MLLSCDAQPFFSTGIGKAYLEISCRYGFRGIAFGRLIGYIWAVSWEAMRHIGGVEREGRCMLLSGAFCTRVFFLIKDG